MEFTGERVIPGEVDPDLWAEHLARYSFAVRILEDAGAPRGVSQRGISQRILDAGCGAGYGAAMLACIGAHVDVTAADTSEEALEWARTHYSGANLRFDRADCTATAYPGETFDAVIAFEVIEHLPDPQKFLGEARRLLKPAGRLIVSTPNRRYYTEERGYQNPFHTREFDGAEFDALLASSFSQRLLFSQNHVAGQAFAPLAGAKCAGTSELAPAPVADEAHFYVAIASALPFAPPPPFVFVPSAGNVLREREQHIHKLEQHSRQAEENAQRELEDRKRWAEAQDAALAERAQTIRQLQSEHAQAIAWARELDDMLRGARTLLDSRQREIDERLVWAESLESERARLARMIGELQQDLETKVEWARSLETDVQSARDALAALRKEFDERTAWALQLDSERGRLDTMVVALRADLEQVFSSRWYRAGKKLKLMPPPPSHGGRGQS